MSTAETDSAAPLPHVLIGAGGHAKVIIDIVERNPSIRLIGLIDSQRSPGERVLGHPVLGPESHIAQLLADDRTTNFIIAVGHNWHRRLIAERLRRAYPDLRFGIAIHPSAAIARTAVIHAGSVIMAGAVIGPDARIGEHCIVNHLCNLDHDAALGDFCSLAPGVTTGGLVSLDEGCAINTGAVIGRGRHIGAHAVIGAGATVIADIPGRAVAFGVPAKIVRNRDPADDYF